MKKGILFLLLAFSFTANSQKLKDLLYSGKLKLDSNSVVRKGDDLSTKIDTGTKKAPEPEKQKAVTVPDASVKQPEATIGVVTAGVVTAGVVTPGVVTDSVTTTDTATKGGAVVIETAAPVKSNTKIWKEYSDSLVKTLKAEVLPLKQIKKETYYLTVEYEIGVDGQVNVLSVISDPEHKFLQSEVQTRMELTVPRLAPTLDSTGKARKVKKRFNFSLTKE